jgi:hypothetical protein
LNSNSLGIISPKHNILFSQPNEDYSQYKQDLLSDQKLSSLSKLGEGVNTESNVAVTKSDCETKLDEEQLYKVNNDKNIFIIDYNQQNSYLGQSEKEKTEEVTIPDKHATFNNIFKDIDEIKKEFYERVSVKRSSTVIVDDSEKMRLYFSKNSGLNELSGTSMRFQELNLPTIETQKVVTMKDSTIKSPSAADDSNKEFIYKTEEDKQAEVINKIENINEIIDPMNDEHNIKDELINNTEHNFEDNAVKNADIVSKHDESNNNNGEVYDNINDEAEDNNNNNDVENSIKSELKDNPSIALYTIYNFANDVFMTLDKATSNYTINEESNLITTLKDIHNTSIAQEQTLEMKTNNYLLRKLFKEFLTTIKANIKSKKLESYYILRAEQYRRYLTYKFKTKVFTEFKNYCFHHKRWVESIYKEIKKTTLM